MRVSSSSLSPSWVRGATILLSVIPTSYAHPQPDACTALSKALPGQVTFPNSTLYDLENSYWSERQADIHPACFVAPKKTADVATAVKTLTSLRQPFSVKGGGHAAFPGASNIEKGVTIDLRHLTDIKVSKDRKTVSVGAGSRWINVSEALEPLGLAVVGGRVADVGVGGLILGGGISYYSGKYGWACDNVRNYEVVLSSGKVVNASPTTNPDLFWALRGGAGTNFGIVTRFDLAAFGQGPLWWRSLIYPGALNTTLIPLFHDLAVSTLPADPDAHTYFVMSHLPILGGFVALTDQFHATPPSPPSSIPPTFAPFTPLPTILNTTTLANASTISRAIDVPYGSHQLWLNTAIRLTPGTSSKSTAYLLSLIPLWQSHVATLLSLTPPTHTTTPFLALQPITTTTLSAMQTHGGNALGLSPRDGPLMIVQLQVSWTDPAMSGEVETRAKELLGRFEKLAGEMGLRTKNGFVYMNYAERGQDVLGGYGKGNLERLRGVAARYDGGGVLKRLWRGYFKV